MITLSSTIQSLMSGGFFGYFYLVDIKDVNGVVWKRVTSHSHNITLSDSRTFVADGTLMNIDPPQVSATVGKDEYKILFADPTFLQGAQVDLGLVGYLVEVRMGFLDIDSTPITDIDNTFFVYAGRISGSGYIIKTEVLGEALLQLSCSNPMGDLDFKKFIYLSKDFIRGRNPNDACCDSIYNGSQAVSLKWGKA